MILIDIVFIGSSENLYRMTVNAQICSTENNLLCQSIQIGMIDATNNTDRITDECRINLLITL